MANNNNNQSFTTRAGLVPKTDKLEYPITTERVQMHLKNSLDALLKTMSNPIDVDLSVFSIEAGSKFVPFMCSLSTNVIVDNKYNLKNKDDEPSIFRPNDNDGSVRLIDPVAKLLSIYAYDKIDGEAFFSSDWRRERGVNTNTAALLKKHRTPHVIKFTTNKGSSNRVMFLLDPIRVFHEMCVIDYDDRDFHVEIVNWNKIRQGEYRYDVLRVLNKKNKNHNNQNFIEALNRQYRNGKK